VVTGKAAPSAPPKAVADAWDAFDDLEAGHQDADTESMYEPGAQAPSAPGSADVRDAFDAVEAQDRAADAESMYEPGAKASTATAATGTPPKAVADTWDACNEVEVGSRIAAPSQPPKSVDAVEAGTDMAASSEPPKAAADAWDAFDAWEAADLHQNKPQHPDNDGKGLCKFDVEALEKLSMQSQLVALGLLSEDEEMSDHERLEENVHKQPISLPAAPEAAVNLDELEDMEIVSNASDD
ncbi:unnamed protein product, partial [Symbiodinium pilosum]